MEPLLASPLWLRRYVGCSVVFVIPMRDMSLILLRDVL